MSIRSVVLSGFLLVCTWVHAAEAPPPIPAAALRRDAALLRDVYQALHPAWPRAGGLDDAYAALLAQFENDRTVGDAFVAFAEFAAALRCGHTGPNFANQREPVASAVLDGPRIPFAFRWVDRRMIVTRRFDPSIELGAGTEVVALDGIPATTLLDRMLRVARGDGGNDAARIASLEVIGQRRHEAFDVFYPLLFPPPAEKTEFALEVRRPGAATTETMSVPAMTAASRRAAVERDLDPAAPPWTLEFTGSDDQAVARLRMPSWAVWGTGFDWRAFLQRGFEAVAARGARHLVIDLRGNEGGLGAVGDALLSYLIANPIARDPVVREARYRSVPRPLRPYLDTWDRSFLDWGDTVVERERGVFRFVETPTVPRTLTPAAPRFAGSVWVLMGPANASATFQFARTVRTRGLGTLVGQTSGGNRRGIHGGAFFFVRLPGSGIELDLPLIAQRPPNDDEPDAGLEPDVAVAPSAEAIASGRDFELDAALQRIAAAERSAVVQTPVAADDSP